MLYLKEFNYKICKSTEVMKLVANILINLPVHSINHLFEQS